MKKPEQRSYAATGPRLDSSGDRMLAILALFSIDAPEWTVEAAAERLGVSAPTTYRYFKRLADAGLIARVSRAGYSLGPAIIEMDRRIQICDPMLRAARPVMLDLIQYAADGAVMLLSRLFHDRVMCAHQVPGRGPQPPVSYERGRLMPLFRGATSKIILAHLPTRMLKALFAANAEEIAAAGLGRDWEEFRQALANVRRAGIAVSRGEIDVGRIGIAAPIFDRDRAILGSLTFVLSGARIDETLIGRLVPLTIAGAREIEQAMNGEPQPHAVSRAPVKVAQ
jgi:DNA-binding IclR family transcriptional regulator